MAAAVQVTGVVEEVGDNSLNYPSYLLSYYTIYLLKTNTMKNILLTVIFLLPFAMMSCKKEQVNNSANLVKVTAQNGSAEALKTAIINSSVDWIAGADHIGFYSDLAYTGTPGNPATNVDYSAQTSANISILSSSTPVYWDGASTVHNFYAYYPYASGTAASTEVPITLWPVQTQVGGTTDHIGALDFTVATPVSLTSADPGGTNPTVNFHFNHVFSILKFDLTCTANRTLKSISVTSDGSSIALDSTNISTIDITQTLPDPGVQYNINYYGVPDVTLKTNLDLSPTAVASAYMVIFPGEANDGDTFTIVYTSSTGATYPVTKTGINFERGKVYTVQQTIPSGLGGF
jgi:hypothetical protein